MRKPLAQWRYNALCKAMCGTVVIAEQQGMQTLASVARDVNGTLHRKDTVAANVSVQWQVQLGEQSLVLVWDPAKTCTV
ncbi:MAG: hypothetical protein GDA36_09480 [Rhodobacteraceae bacterium]|nr:hypothetical protein [Paracoccaceae bacterium]